MLIYLHIHSITLSRNFTSHSLLTDKRRREVSSLPVQMSYEVNVKSMLTTWFLSKNLIDLQWTRKCNVWIKSKKMSCVLATDSGGNLYHMSLLKA